MCQWKSRSVQTNKSNRAVTFKNAFYRKISEWILIHIHAYEHSIVRRYILDTERGRIIPFIFIFPPYRRSVFIFIRSICCSATAQHSIMCSGKMMPQVLKCQTIWKCKCDITEKNVTSPNNQAK